MVIKNRSIFSISLKLVVFIMPFFLLISIVLILDPLKVFRDYDDYYKDNFVNINRELICLKLYDKNSKFLKYDSYIFGSSRSHAFRVENWLKFLPSDASGFHFDANGESIYGIYNKMRYIDETGGSIKNALIVLDYFTLTATKNREGFLFISPPQLSKEPSYKFYVEQIKPVLDIKYTVGYLDYYIFKKYRCYMEGYFNDIKNINISNNNTGDLYYYKDKIIDKDPIAYYSKMINSGVFYDRSRIIYKPVRVDESEINLVNNIKKLLIKHNTNYKIVISPCYDQVRLGYDHLKLLTDFFGNNVYDYSGVNKYTNSVYNYYEDEHYRPHVANEIMRTIYSLDLR